MLITYVHIVPFGTQQLQIIHPLGMDHFKHLPKLF